jgi:hypothetical protein
VTARAVEQARDLVVRQIVDAVVYGDAGELFRHSFERPMEVVQYFRGHSWVALFFVAHACVSLEQS